MNNPRRNLASYDFNKDCSKELDRTDVQDKKKTKNWEKAILNSR